MDFDEHDTPPERRLIDPHGGAPLAPRAQPGYYPGFSTLEQQDFWDAATRETVRRRMSDVPAIRFFSPGEAQLMEVLCAHLLPQDDRVPARRIPIVPFIDERLHTGRTPGYRFESMPPDGEAYRLGFEAIERIARANHDGCAFTNLSWRAQEDLLKSIHDAAPMPGAEEIWQRMPVERYFALLMQDCVEVYYAHPWAWDEIGFGGPAYPRGYMRLEHGLPEPWEVSEKRYPWAAPREHWVSDPKQGEIAAHHEQPAAGQGGTH